MNQAMGLRKSPLGYIIFCGGLTGFLTAASLEFIPSSFLYPLIVHGKPMNFFTVPAFFPIMFELTILFSAFAAFFAMLIMNGLPRPHHPIFNWERFGRATNDAFFLVIEARDPRFTEVEAHELLEKSGGQHITIIHDDLNMLRGFLLIFLLFGVHLVALFGFPGQQSTVAPHEIFPELIHLI